MWLFPRVCTGPSSSESWSGALVEVRSSSVLLSCLGYSVLKPQPSRSPGSLSSGLGLQVLPGLPSLCIASSSSGYGGFVQEGESVLGQEGKWAVFSSAARRVGSAGSHVPPAMQAGCPARGGHSAIPVLLPVLRNISPHRPAFAARWFLGLNCSGTSLSPLFSGYGRENTFAFKSQFKYHFLRELSMAACIF